MKRLGKIFYYSNEPYSKEVHFLISNYENLDEPKKLSIELIKVNDSEFKYNIVELKDGIEDILNELPLVSCKTLKDYYDNCLRIAEQIRIGRVNIHYKTFHFHSHCIGTPLKIIKKDNLYAIIKNPMFNAMGFKLSIEDSVHFNFDIR